MRDYIIPVMGAVDWIMLAQFGRDTGFRRDLAGQWGVSNEGFRGMGVTRGEAYDFSAQIRTVSGTPRVNVQLVGEDGTLFASAPLTTSAEWSQATATLTPKDTDGKARLAIFVDGPGT